MALLKTMLALLLLLSFAYAHTDGEMRFVNGYIIEFHSDTLEFLVMNESGSPIAQTPVVQIFRGDRLFKQETAHAAEEEFYYGLDSLPPGTYEIRPIYEIGDKFVSARFTYENNGGLIDKIISFLVKMIFGEKTADVHEHADLAVYINGQKLNLSQEKYMENSSRPFSEVVHFHDLNGNVVHKHAVGVNIGHFFGTIGMKFNSTCFAIDNETYCGVRMFVNGQENSEFDKYEFKDLDRILIAVGNYSENEIQEMVVTDEACIQSKKCPDRGNPSEEDSCSLGKCE